MKQFRVEDFGDMLILIFFSFLFLSVRCTVRWP